MQVKKHRVRVIMIIIEDSLGQTKCKMEEEIKCYMCDKIAITREHVPPLCLFPEAKDVKGLNFRQNLITVPSCDEHNSKKSNEDEFLMVSIAGVVGNNLLGYLHTQSKVSRALRRKSSDFINKVVLKNAKSIDFETKDGTKYPVLLGNPDLSRLKKCFEYIAYGLYYHEFNHSFKGNMKVIPGFVKYDDKDINMLVELMRRKIEVDEITIGKKGDNPYVFQYEFCKPDKFGLFALRIVFYGAADVYIGFQPENSEDPFDLTIALLNSGIHTTIDIKGQTFEFNKEEK